MSGSVSLMALALNPTKLPNALCRCCTPLSVTDRPDARAPATGDRDGLRSWLLRPPSGEEELMAGRHSSEGPGGGGETEEARRMLVRTATSFSASTLVIKLA